MRSTLLFTLLLIAHNVLSDDFIVRTKDTGFYKISQTEIKKLGFDKSKISLGDLSISGETGDSPYFFSSRKSNLKSNDNLIFFSEALKGEFTRQHALDDLNGFKLSKSNLITKSWFTKKNASKKLPTCEKVITSDHYEINKYLIRVKTDEFKATPELWYWKQLSYLLKDGFSIPIDVSRANGMSDMSLTVAFRSRNIDFRAIDVPDHQMQILLNGTLISTLEWEGKVQHFSEKLKLPQNLLKPDSNTVTFKVPKRLLDGKTIVDTSMLDYFDLEFEIDQSKITASDSLSSNKKCKVKLDKNQFSFSKFKKKYAFKTVELNPNSQVFIGTKSALKSADIQNRSKIVADFSEIEYLIITHPSFTNSTQVLANFYNNKGIKTSIISTQQIFQKYSYGVRELHSMKDLIRDIHSAGDGKLKYVLLVGDASWDWRDNGQNNKYGKWANRNDVSSRDFTNFPHQKSYTSQYINRDFVPTGQYHSPEGHSASDNWFASIVPEKNIKGEDYIPDIAIGRFPVSTTDELDAMIAKTINYTNNTKVGPWKSRVLWITNSELSLQKTSTMNARTIEKHGVVANNIFPNNMDEGRIKAQETLSNSFDEGNLVVHFIGHGGKSIWRVGPADLTKNRDLFTLDHISKLKNSKRLPFVLSMSCYSAPFDHPFADSIGEKFIREPDVGAVAVLASSWRNAPNALFSRYVLESLYENPKHSVGQAVLAGKRRYRGRIMVEMYNLLGDPALRLAIPALKMTSTNKDNEITVNIESKSFHGKAIVEIIDMDSNVLSSKEVVVPDTNFNIKLGKQDPACHLGKIYAWDTEQNIDAMSSFNCS